MPRMSVDDRRTRLLDAAIVVMKRDGVPQTTTRAIVAEAGMQIGVFHYCFRSKEELVFEVLRLLTERSFGAVGSILGQSGSTAEAIRLGLAAYWEHVRANPEERLLIFELTHHSLRHTGHEGAAQALFDNYGLGVETFLAHAAALDGAVFTTDPAVLSRYAIAHMQGVTLQWLVSRDEALATQLLDQLTRHLIDDARVPTTDAPEVSRRSDGTTAASG